MEIPGKLNPSHNAAYVAYGGKEHVKHEYEVLIQKVWNMPSKYILQNMLKLEIDIQ